MPPLLFLTPADPHIYQFERNYPNTGYLTCDLSGEFLILENQFITITGFGRTDLFPDVSLYLCHLDT